jgi:hypothetical protein
MNKNHGNMNKNNNISMFSLCYLRKFLKIIVFFILLNYNPLPSYYAFVTFY